VPLLKITINTPPFAVKGYAACLSEALRELPEIPLGTVYKQMKESTEVMPIVVCDLEPLGFD